MNLRHQRMFQYVGERSVPDVVHQNSCQCTVIFRFSNGVSFFFQCFQCLIHQKHGPYGMMKTGVLGSGIDKSSQAQLSDAV